MTKVDVRTQVDGIGKLRSWIVNDGPHERMRRSLRSLIEALPKDVKNGHMPKGHRPTILVLMEVLRTMEPIDIKNLSLKALSFIATKADSDVVSAMEALVVSLDPDMDTIKRVWVVSRLVTDVGCRA